MESLHFTQELPQTQIHFMNKLSPKLKPTISFISSIDIRAFCAASPTLTQTQTQNLNQPQIIVPDRRRRVKASDAQLKENWLASLSYPIPEKTHLLNEELELNEGSKWVLGVDPDVSGAVAILKTHGSVCSAQVLDSPHVQILVGKRTRRRLDAKSVVQMVRSFDAPVGTTVYIEQSLPYPQDGKQGWWSGGFGYGLWIGILVASGFCVVPVPSATWKAKFELTGSKTAKDDSRRVASTLFPSLSSLLSRKKDHGRAEALLIAAYGKEQMNSLESSSDTIFDKLKT
ncbi:Holliday junction resolvase MOC1, chloroplastic-like [Gastrolobium bilobum]|uniref:Holliday junction resolvase MOC1, chloroplastic-like n=1 Tax=Gastrolobium bilobum TaxID=150636 RepID=UPI002AB109D1|nr:Holliday junction resolvase MOC1, chloroplastic-like [Gastrolobium bilobum]